MADEVVHLEAQEFIGPVTSLSFCSKAIISGEGPYIRIFDIASGLLFCEQNVLPRCRVHGIIVEPKRKKLVAIYGQKSVRVFQFSSHSSSVWSVSPVTEVSLFPDLIWCIHWLYTALGDPETIAIATAHNAVWLWHWQDGAKDLVAHCEEQSILYTAKFFGQSLNDIILASGTVFNEILIWKVMGQKNEAGNTTISHRLTGHEGVIFSINFNKTASLIATVSDDRSIRLWKVTGLLQQINCKVEPLNVMFGHAARVWDVKLLRYSVVSVGEDATCCIWDYSGQMKKKFKGHKGRSIWSLAISDEEDIVATGGGDGSIRLWPLGETADQTHCSVVATLPCSIMKENSKYDIEGPIQEQQKDFPRLVSLLSLQEILVMTNKGCLYVYNCRQRPDNEAERGESSNASEPHWSLLLSDQRFASYSLMSLSPCRRLIAFGNLKGCVKLCSVGMCYHSAEVKPYSGKVLSLVWTTVDCPSSLISCGPEGQMHWWRVIHNLQAKELRLEPLCSFLLPPSKQRWVTCAELIDLPQEDQKKEQNKVYERCLLLCGDRKGSLHVYDARKRCNKKATEPSHSLRGVHGRIGVSHICVREGCVFTAGRDGFYRQCKIRHDLSLEVIDKKKVYKGLEWIEKLIFAPNGDLLIAGFHTAFFVLWSVGRNELILRMKCGGGHRAWDFILQQDLNVTKAVFTFLKGQQLFAEHVTLRSPIGVPFVKPSFHGRETTCICRLGHVYSSKGERFEILATGSEDTDINLVGYNYTNGRIRKLFTAQGHISSVRALSAVACGESQQGEAASTGDNCEGEAKCQKALSTSCSKYLLFSCGGRASLKCWRVDLTLSVETFHPSGCHDNTVTSSPMVLLAEYSTRVSKYRRRRKLEDQMHSEIRFMCLSTVNVRQFSDKIFHEQNKARAQELYIVCAACSDGFVRLFGFDEAQRQFVLLSQSEYLKRCVLSVTSVVHRDPGKRPYLILFAGDTAGRITVWDVTQHVINYIKEIFEADDCLSDGLSDAMINNPLERVSQEKYNRLQSNSDDKFDIPREPEVLLTNACSKCELVEEEKTTNAVKYTHPTRSKHEVKCKESMQSLKGSEIFESDCCKELACSEDSADNVSVEELQTKSLDCSDYIQDVQSSAVNNKSVSCVPLVESTLKPPLTVFAAHQSGVNKLSVVSLENDDAQYLLVSGGDDGALYMVEFQLVTTYKSASKQLIFSVDKRKETCVSSAHFSSVTGVKVFPNGCFLTSSVDQRLQLWSFSHQGDEATVQCVSNEFVDVSDIQDIEAWQDSTGNVRAAICGVGLQTVKLTQNGRSK